MRLCLCVLCVNVLCFCVQRSDLVWYSMYNLIHRAFNLHMRSTELLICFLGIINIKLNTKMKRKWSSGSAAPAISVHASHVGFSECDVMFLLRLHGFFAVLNKVIGNKYGILQYQRLFYHIHLSKGDENVLELPVLRYSERFLKSRRFSLLLRVIHSSLVSLS